MYRSRRWGQLHRNRRARDAHCAAAVREPEMLAFEVGVEQRAQQARDLRALRDPRLLPVQLAAELPHVLGDVGAQLRDALGTRRALPADLE